jgi:glycosyltransferase involved in cell wall biosynthesis
MDPQPKVSILLPCLNAQPYLTTRIDSLLAQTCTDWEAIVLDSQSTDGSWEFFQSIASADPRFRLFRISREGVYAALNRGIELARGKFLLIATCDDTMHAEFLATLLEAFAICPEAGLAACDVSFINRDGGQLTREEMTGYLPTESIDDMLGLEVVRSYPTLRSPNYRSPPHDCILHFSAKSVYFSLTQLLIRASLLQAAGPFDTTVGSIADLGWLVRLTNLTGTVHVPRKLTMWRFHGSQLSVRRDSSHLGCLKGMFERALPEIYQRHRSLLKRSDCATLMLPIKCYLANTPRKRVFCCLEATFRILLMSFQRPVATLRAIRASRFLPHKVKRSLVPMFLQRMEMSPRVLDACEVTSAPREIFRGSEGRGELACCDRALKE